LLDIIMLNKKGTAGFNTRLCLFCWPVNALIL